MERSWKEGLREACQGVGTLSCWLYRHYQGKGNFEIYVLEDNLGYSESSVANASRNRDKDVENKCMNTKGEGGGVAGIRRLALAYIHY